MAAVATPRPPALSLFPSSGQQHHPNGAVHSHLPSNVQVHSTSSSGDSSPVTSDERRERQEWLDQQNQRQEKLQVPERIKKLYSSAEVIKAFHLCWDNPQDQSGLKTLKETVEKIRGWAPELERQQQEVSFSLPYTYILSQVGLFKPKLDRYEELHDDLAGQEAKEIESYVGRMLPPFIANMNAKDIPIIDYVPQKRKELVLQLVKKTNSDQDIFSQFYREPSTIDVSASETYMKAAPPIRKLWTNPKDQIAAAEVESINKKLSNNNCEAIPVDKFKEIATKYHSTTNITDKENALFWMALWLIFANFPVKEFMPPEFGRLIQDAESKQLNTPLQRAITESQQQDAASAPQEQQNNVTTDTVMEDAPGFDQTDEAAATKQDSSARPGYTELGEEILCYFPAGRGFRFAVRAENGPPELRSGQNVGDTGVAYRDSKMAVRQIKTSDIPKGLRFQEILWVASAPIQSRKAGKIMKLPTTVCAFKDADGISQIVCRTGLRQICGKHNADAHINKYYTTNNWIAPWNERQDGAVKKQAVIEQAVMEENKMLHQTLQALMKQLADSQAVARTSTSN
jgi:hypothetical protein